MFIIYDHDEMYNWNDDDEWQQQSFSIEKVFNEKLRESNHVGHKVLFRQVLHQEKLAHIIENIKS